MSRVVIDGLEYSPFINFDNITKEMILQCTKELVSIQYFNIKHKNRAVAWDALNALSPNLANLVSDNKCAAYELLNGTDDCANEFLENKNNGRPEYIPKVVVDGIEYIPNFNVKKIQDDAISNCLKELVSLQYFNEEHKNRAVAWDALNALNPKLANICSEDPNKAYNLINS